MGMLFSVLDRSLIMDSAQGDESLVSGEIDGAFPSLSNQVVDKFIVFN